jgi:hypothetical protein
MFLHERGTCQITDANARQFARSDSARSRDAKTKSVVANHVDRTLVRRPVAWACDAITELRERHTRFLMLGGRARDGAASAARNHAQVERVGRRRTTIGFRASFWHRIRLSRDTGESQQWPNHDLLGAASRDQGQRIGFWPWWF